MAKHNNMWSLALLAGYLEGEDVFRTVCQEYCSMVFPQSNTLAVILPLILSQGKAKLEGVSLESWPRLLSGILSTVSSAVSTSSPKSARIWPHNTTSFPPRFASW